MLALYAGRGYRVLGCAERGLSAEHAAAAAAGSLTRAEAEAAGQLRFVGLAVLENKLKPSSAGVIAALQAAEMNVCMITGDHARTAVTVGRAANILSRDVRVLLCDASPGGVAAYTKLAMALGEADEAVDGASALGSECESCRFVVTGAGFDALLAAAEQGAPEALACVLKRMSIAARFQPHQKQRAVSLFIENGEYTAFVGDGANDSAALKAADVGLSLIADAEASVAAPFTSKDAELVSCITLLLEGRAALATGFQLFKYMVRLIA
jgi:cation-transporting ATPase 13A3/4/5